MIHSSLLQKKHPPNPLLVGHEEESRNIFMNISKIRSTNQKKTAERQEGQQDESISHNGKIDTSLTSKKATEESYEGHLHQYQVRHDEDQ